MTTERERPFEPIADEALEYKGPPIDSLRSTIVAPEKPGVYQIRVSGSLETSDVTAAAFSVSADL